MRRLPLAFARRTTAPDRQSAMVSGAKPYLSYFEAPIS